MPFMMSSIELLSVRRNVSRKRPVPGDDDDESDPVSDDWPGAEGAGESLGFDESSDDGSSDGVSGFDGSERLPGDGVVGRFGLVRDFFSTCFKMSRHDSDRSGVGLLDRESLFERFEFRDRLPRWFGFESSEEDRFAEERFDRWNSSICFM